MLTPPPLPTSLTLDAYALFFCHHCGPRRAAAAAFDKLVALHLAYRFVLACSTSSMLRSCSPPFSGLYTSVPLMITVCAGRLTPHARVAVHTRTFAIASDAGTQEGRRIEGEKSKCVRGACGRKVPRRPARPNAQNRGNGLTILAACTKQGLPITQTRTDTRAQTREAGSTHGENSTLTVHTAASFPKLVDG